MDTAWILYYGIGFGFLALAAFGAFMVHYQRKHGIIDADGNFCEPEKK